MPLYRYSPQQYTNSLLSLGLIRIGTLHDFRRIEHNQGIADPQEGKKAVLHNINQAFFTDKYKDHNHSGALKAFGIMDVDSITGPSTVMFRNVTLRQRFDVPDRFILCFSDRYSLHTMSQFEGADSCYHIQNDEAFIQIITQALNSIVPIRFKGIYKVKYGDRSEKWNGKNWGGACFPNKRTDFF